MEDTETTKPTINGRKEYRFKAEDIKQDGRLTAEQVCDIPLDKVFEWIKTGQWRRKDFERWCKCLRII